MSKPTPPAPQNNPTAQMSIMYFLLWMVNAVVIMLANMLFPSNIVLGTMSLNPTIALLLSSGVLAWLGTITMPIFTEIEVRQQQVLSPMHWMIGYFIINVISLWIVARLAEALGLGVSSWLFVVGLALILDIVQGMTIMAYGQISKK